MFLMKRVFVYTQVRDLLEEFCLQIILNMSENNQILNLLQSKSSTKQEVFRTTFTAFKKLTKILEKKSTELSEVMKDKDKFVEIGFHKKGDFESHINFSGDRLIFHILTNVFDFPNNHSIQRHPT